MLGIKIINFKKFNEMEQTIREQRSYIRELKIDLDEVKQYEDWDWECPMPRLGG